MSARDPKTRKAMFGPSSHLMLALVAATPRALAGRGSWNSVPGQSAASPRKYSRRGLRRRHRQPPHVRPVPPRIDLRERLAGKLPLLRLPPVRFGTAQPTCPSDTHSFDPQKCAHRLRAASAPFAPNLIFLLLEGHHACGRSHQVQHGGQRAKELEVYEPVHPLPRVRVVQSRVPRRVRRALFLLLSPV